MKNAFSILVLDFQPEFILGEQDADSKITPHYYRGEDSLEEGS